MYTYRYALREVFEGTLEYGAFADKLVDRAERGPIRARPIRAQGGPIRARPIRTLRDSAEATKA